MNLLNYTLRYLAIAMLVMISIWAVIFYVNMLDEVYDSLDDGLDNYKMLVINKVHQDPATLAKTEFGEGNYEIREIAKRKAFAVRDVYTDTLMYMMNEKDLEPVRMLTTAFMHGNRFYELKVISSMVEEDDLIEDLFYSLIWLYVALIAGILIINNFLLKKVWQPFYGLVDQLKAFRLGKDQTIVPVDTKVKEFKILNESVTALLKHTQEAFESQKQFIENASHELQTPVAISINKLELLAESTSLSDADLQSVSTVIKTLERLKRLNKSLLLLSKIENRQFSDVTPVSLNRVFENVVNEFSDFAEYKEITVSLHEHGELNVLMQKDLAGILISNLLKNALVHNHANGSVNVIIGKDYFEVSNTGNPESLEANGLFKRFQKDGGNHNGTGLGLSIVKAIADLYFLSVAYSFNGSQHSMRVSVI